MINYPLATSSWGWREKLAAMRPILTAQTTMGKHVSEFEDAFAKYHDVPFAVMVNSGSSANLVALTAMVLCEGYDLNPGDEVIVPAISWSTTYFPLSQLGLIPVFVDVGRDFNIATHKIEEAISPKTKAIFAVNLLGTSCAFKELQEICRIHKLYLFEDNCESLGSRDETCGSGIKAGTAGVFGTFSSFFSHHIQTMEGGMVITEDITLWRYMRSIRAHGWTRDNYWLKYEDLPEFKRSFNFVLPGYCLRPSEISGIVGKIQLKKLPKFLKQRRENAKKFIQLFGSDSSSFQIQNQFSDRSSWYGFGIVIKERYAKPGLRDMLAKILKNNGVETRPIVAGNFVNQPAFKYLNARISGTLENANYIDDHGLFFGNSHLNLSKKIEQTYELLEKHVK